MGVEQTSSGDSMTSAEIAELYIAQTDRWERDGTWTEGEISAITVWEKLITDDPERAWPVFLEIVARRTNDEMLYQVGHRLHLLLHRHYDAFFERAYALVRGVPRFPRVIRPGFFDPEHFIEKPLDINALIEAHETMDRHTRNAWRLKGFIDTDPARALDLAIEIIHRGPSHGLSSFDTFDPLRDLLLKHGAAVIDRVEEIARGSYLVRRALWRMVPSQRGTPERWKIPADIWQRVIAANAGTTDWTDDIEPQPALQRLSAMDESILTAWFAYEENFWSFSTMADLVDEEPETAWPVFLTMLERATDEKRIGNLAAGPLERMLRNHGEQFIDRITTEARSNEKMREALRGVWIFEDDAIHARYLVLMAEIGAG